MKVLVADDHGLYRSGLGFLLRDQLGVGEVIEVGTLDDALDMLARHPGLTLALFDLSMPGMAGPESLGTVKATYPDTFMAVISASEDRENVVKSIAAGLSGYIPKTLPEDEIAKALAMMLAGAIFVPPFMIAGAPPAPPPAAPPEPQRDVLGYIL
ncbi:response regulator, partial [Rhodomicrobium vannielii]|uniref:response regulator n=1 Tax=Rhodomicrobium vannielii TaxID=1069 RepID=UPI003D7C2EE7